MLIHVKVEADSNKDEVIEKSDVSYIVKVKDSAKQNQANIKMLTLLSAYLRLDKSRLRMISGHHSPGKILEILDTK